MCAYLCTVHELYICDSATVAVTFLLALRLEGNDYALVAILITLFFYTS